MSDGDVCQTPTPEIEVCLHVDTNGVLSCTAVDTTSQRQEQWLREGYMAARV
jgi:hypothetical protein